jgi:hypothetical protein
MIVMIKDNLNIEGARIGFRNFSGKEGKFNPAGRRNFCVFLDFDAGNQLQEDGWKIKWLQPKDPADEPQPYLPVSVSYDNIPPKIVLVSSKGKTVLEEDDIKNLDWAEIDNVDVIIRPYNWEVNGNKGVKAYVKTMYVTIVEDNFADKYKDVPDSAQDSIGGCGNCDECDGGCDCGSELPFK